MMNKLKFIKELRENLTLKIAILLLFFSYFLLKKSNIFIYIYIISIMNFLFVLINSYYTKSTDKIKLSLILLIDITYLILFQLNLIYIFINLLASIAFIYTEAKKTIDRKSLYIAIEFILIYMITKLFIILSMIYI